MPQEQDPSPEPIAERLALKLKSVRDEHASAPENQRRELLRRALDEELGSLPEAQTEAVLDTLRDRLVLDAREREARVAELEQRVQGLQGEIESLRAERDRLAEDNERLAQQPAEAAAPAAMAASGEGLERIREGLKQMAKGKKVTAESIGLAESEARLFRLLQEMLRFAQDYEMGLNFLLAEFRVGPQADMDTKMIRGMTQQVRKRFGACLEDREGSVEELKEVLARNARFLIDLNKAYSDSFHEGVQSLLGELDPQPILEEHKRMLGFNFEDAWKAIARVQNDLANLPRSELWERFFFEKFQAKLSGYLGG